MRKTLIFLILLLFLVIVLAPSITIITKAFISQANVSSKLIELCLNERTIKLFNKSIIISAGSTFFALLVGIPLGFLMCRTNIYFKNTAQYLFLLPILIPSYISAIAWYKYLPFKGLPAVIWILGLSYFPFISLLTIAGLSNLDKKYEEQARLVFSRQKVLTKITLPLIAPYLAGGAIITFIFSLSNFSVPSLFGVNTYPMDIFAQFSAFYNHAQASLLSLPLLFIAFVLLVILYLLMRGRSFVCLGTKDIAGIALNKNRLLFSLIAWTVIFISGILPFCFLVISAASLQAYISAFKLSIQPLINSLWLSALGASICVALGFFIAHCIRNARSKFKIFLDAGSILPLVVPPTVLGIGLINFWNRPFLSYIYSSYWIIIFGFVACFIPFAIKIIDSNFRQIHTNLEEAAILSGAGGIKTFCKILLPLMKPAIFAAWIVCFIFCMGEISMTILVMPAGFETLSSKIYTLMHYGVGELTSALCVILIVLTMLPAAFVAAALRKTRIH